MKNIVLILLFIFFFSCQQKESKNTVVSVSDTNVTKKIETDKEITEEANQQVNEQKGDTIFMNFKDEKGLYAAEGDVDSIHPKVYVKFKNEDFGKLNAKIIPPGGKGNIRFNQIIFPDKTADGPFGADLKINAEQKGDYILIIGHSQMAENPYWGKFKVQLETRKK